MATASCRESVAAMLAREVDPVPLPWLVELLVRSGYHPTITRETLKRQKARWLERVDFPADKILWKE